MKLGSLLMPSHPPEASIREGQHWDLNHLGQLDVLGFEEAWIGERHTAAWEPCQAPDLLIAQALLRTKKIRLGPPSHLLPFHHLLELAYRIAYLDHLAEGRYQLGVGIGVLPTDHDLFALDASGGRNRRMTFEFRANSVYLVYTYQAKYKHEYTLIHIKCFLWKIFYYSTWRHIINRAGVVLVITPRVCV